MLQAGLGRAHSATCSRVCERRVARCWNSRMPAFTTTARGRPGRRCARFTSTDAECSTVLRECGRDGAGPFRGEERQVELAFAVRLHAGVHRARARIPAADVDCPGGRFRRHYGYTAGRSRPIVLRQPEHQVHVLDRLARRALDQVIQHADRHEHPVSLIDHGVDEAHVVAERVLGVRRRVGHGA